MHMAYAVTEGGVPVEISVYDLAGRRMKTLVSGIGSAGRHDVAWDGRDESGAHVRRGMYFIHIRIGDQARQVRVTFVN
jgi:flagellar hook assembly protein FlgD